MTNYVQLWTKKVRSVLNFSANWVLGILWLTLGILTSVWTPYEVMMNERLRMRPGLPAYEWWLHPPPCLLRVYIFNITNADRFLSGEDRKLHMQEVGPIIYREYWKHENVVFNSNGTMSYTVTRTVRYAEDLNGIDFNATIIVPNIAILMTISHYWDASIVIKMGLNYIFRKLDSQPIIQTTIYNFLHNTTDPFLDFAHNLAPFFAPIRNLGVIDVSYTDSSDNVTAFMGTDRGHQMYSLIDKYHGSSNIPGQPDSCKFKITNASEGVVYNQKITKESVVRYYRRSVCRVIPLYYEGEDSSYGIPTYRFVMPDTALDRIDPPQDDCFDNEPSLPNGITDVSKCFFSFPMTASYVYFQNKYQDSNMFPKIDIPKGRIPPRSYIHLEPSTGIPLVSSAAMQANMYIKPLKGFNKVLDKFSDQIIPVAWMHYYNDEIPLKVVALIYLTLAMPLIGWVLTTFFFLSSFYCLWKSVRRKPISGKLEETDIELARQNGNLENESFLARS